MSAITRQNRTEQLIHNSFRSGSITTVTLRRLPERSGHGRCSEVPGPPCRTVIGALIGTIAAKIPKGNALPPAPKLHGGR
jgi:hypothetical protein